MEETSSRAVVSQSICSGCGVKLQSELPDKIGYTPASAMGRNPLTCQRCFRIKHYNEIASATVNPADFLEILSQLGKSDALIVHIADLFDFEGSLISGLHRFVGNVPVLLVVNKIDLLPKAMNPNRILNWVQKQAKANGIWASRVVLCSARKNIGFDRVVEALGEMRGNRNIAVIGATNVGKSTLINRLIRDYSDLEAELTTSPYPGTTLGVVNIPLDDGKMIIDTPGIVYSSRLTELVEKQDLQTVLPEKPIKPTVFQLNEQQSLFFGALARFDFVKGERQSFTCYTSNALTIHRTKLEKADELYREHRGVLLSPPGKDDLDKLPPFTKHAIRIPKGANKDVLISGLGWIKVNGTTGAELVIHAPRGVKVVMRDSLI
ncbi:ribosome biogenesis GTPase YqeH [Paenibacillus koleovorans]|uniref:ribosome biogenesis GTPase YqeH n=1 Tax=Paenibacillus koleovorans TaxID=121608 RepID=UPI000FD6BA68|nr:ribosome biogenesis GTPase YqeH [Paenibacillus koleovorans]